MPASIVVYASLFHNIYNRVIFHRDTKLVCIFTLFSIKLDVKLLLEISRILHGDHLESDESVVNQMIPAHFKLEIQSRRFAVHDTLPEGRGTEGMNQYR